MASLTRPSETNSGLKTEVARYNVVGLKMGDQSIPDTMIQFLVFRRDSYSNHFYPLLPLNPAFKYRAFKFTFSSAASLDAFLATASRLSVSI